jgi:hypothetical protein
MQKLDKKLGQAAKTEIKSMEKVAANAGKVISASHEIKAAKDKEIKIIKKDIA